MLRVTSYKLQVTSYKLAVCPQVFVSVIALMCWLKQAEELPEELVPVIPFEVGSQDLQTAAWTFTCSLQLVACSL